MFTIAALAAVGLAGTSLTSCSRSSDNNDPIITAVPIEQAIVGTWKLTKKEGKIKETEITLENLNEFSHFQLINSMNEFNQDFVYSIEELK